MSSPDAERVKAWRVANRDRYRDYQRDLMRRRRGKTNKEEPRPQEPSGVLAPVVGRDE
jgi:hypothetical protein